MALVDIVVATYQRPKELTQALHSVQVQSFTDWECWVSEDGATDATRAALAPFLADSRFHLVTGEHSGLPAVTRNRAIKLGQSKYLAFLDDDDIWLQDKLVTQFNFLQKNSDCVLVASNAFRWDGEGDPLLAHDLYNADLPDRFIGRTSIERENPFINSTVLVSRAAVEACNYFPEDSALRAREDFFLWQKITYTHKTAVLRAALIVYRDLPLQSIRRFEHVVPSNSFKKSLKKNLKRVFRKLVFAGNRIFKIDEVNAGLHYEKVVAEHVKFLMRGQQASTETCECVIFSKDRALQLHALLSSMQFNFDKLPPTQIIYAASNSQHDAAYNEVKNIFASSEKIKFIKQSASFKNDLIHCLECVTSPKIFFLVDDIVFTHKVTLDDFTQYDCQHFVPSLRMGRNIVHSYTEQKNLNLPTIFHAPEIAGEMLLWQYSDGNYDWNYPLSVDGHVFSTAEILALTREINFRAPNSYEANLQLFRPYFVDRLGVSYTESCFVNIACNKVQTENDNIFGSMHQDELLSKWNAVMQMDWRALQGFVNESPQQDIAFNFVPREKLK